MAWRESSGDLALTYITQTHWKIAHLNSKPSGGRLNIKMSSYQYRDSHVKDKTVSPTVLSLTCESPYLGKTVFILRRGPGQWVNSLTLSDPYASVNYVIIGSDNGLSPVRYQAITWTTAEELWVKFWSQFMKMRLKMLSAKWRHRSGSILACLPDCNKLLPEPMLTSQWWVSVAFTLEHRHLWYDEFEIYIFKIVNCQISYGPFG